MFERLHRGLIPLLLVAQGLAVVMWWIWIDAFAFEQSTMFSMLIKFFVVGVVIGGWYFIVTLLGKKWFGWDEKLMGMRDTVAGSLLILLPFILAFTPILIKLMSGFDMKLISSVWLPGMVRSKVVGSGPYTMIMFSGLFIISTIALKIINILIMVFKHSLEKLTVNKLFIIGFFGLLALLSWPAVMAVPNFGEISQLLVTESISYDAAFHVDGVLGRGEYFRYYPNPSIGFKGYVDGMSRLFLPVAPGMPLLFMAFYLIAGRWFAAVLTMAFAAGAAAQLFGLCKDQGFKTKSSFLVWVLALFTAPLMLYGYQLVEVTAAAFFLTLGLRLALKTNNTTESDSIALSAAVGFFSGLVWLAGIRLIVPSLVIMSLLYFYLRKNKRLNELWAAGGIMLIPAGLAFLFFTSVYNIFVVHPVYQFNMPWSLGFWTNLMAMFTDRYSGLLWHSPIWLVSIAGLIWMFIKRDRKDLVISIGIMLLSLVVFGMVMPDPRAEGSSLNRLMAIALPLTGIGLAAVFERLEGSKWLNKIVLWLSGWSLAVGLILTALPDLANEAVRVKLLSSLKINFLYNLLPGFGDHTSIVQMLVSIILFLGVGYFIYMIIEKLDEPNSVVEE